MKKYRIIFEVNREQIFGEEISDAEKYAAVISLLDRVNVDDTEKRPRNALYPYFYLPPDVEGRKPRLIQGYLPKTNLLYRNHYELEILRLLAMFAPSEPKVDVMLKATLERLKNTCFGMSCTKGEHFAAGICVVRLLAAIKTEPEWTDTLLRPLGDAFLSFNGGQAASQINLPLSYLLMAFTDVKNDYTMDLIEQKKKWLLALLRKGWITGRLSNGKISEGDRYNLMGKYIIRNALGILPEYADIAGHAIYVDPSDERCYCDI